MMKQSLKYTTNIILLIAVCISRQVYAQSVSNAGDVQNSQAPADVIRSEKIIIENHPDSVEAHTAYIEAVGLNNSLLERQYKVWMEKYPKDVTIPLVIGTAYYNRELPQAQQFLLRAAALAPQNANIWFMLWADAERWGQHDLSTQYIKKATLADTSNAGYAFYYLTSFEDGDEHSYKLKVFDFVKRFPANERGAQALYWLGENATNLDDKINYFEELRKLYPPQKFKWSASGMTGLTDAYLQTDPEKALTLTNEMGNGKDWDMRKQIAQSLIKINKLEQDQNYSDAIAEFDQIKTPKYNHIDDFIALKKSALQEKAGYVKIAYDSLAVKFAKFPTDQLYIQIESYGTKIGKDKEQVSKDIQTIRNNNAIPAYPFELGRYNDSSMLKLADLKGKVVLLTFWFPGCGPCRAEFPYLQSVINKFKNNNIIYLGINVLPGQDPYVIPFMGNTHYSFIPLRGSLAFAAKYYGIQGEPENFLINKDGKIVFKNFRIDNANGRMLELMISSLL